MGACFSLPLITALIYMETSSIRAFSLVILFCLAAGSLLRRLCRSSIDSLRIKPRETYLLVATVWLIASAIGALPYMLTGALPNFFDAFFETASGFTTTGATVIDGVEALPRAVLIWRSLSQWLGGMGIIVLFVAFLPSFGIKARNIAAAETPGPTVTKLSSTFTGTAQRLYIAYIILTAAMLLLLMAGNVSFYDSLNHSFTTMATGGFSTYSNSIAHFGSNYVTWVITIFMFLAGTNFELFFVLFSGSIKKVMKNEEFRLYASIVFAATLLISISLMTQGGYTDAFQSLTDSAFQVMTILSTTGYATVDFNLWPTLCLMLIVILMIIGGSSSSTAGGIKVIRLLVLSKLLRREVSLKLHERSVNDIRVNRHKLLPETLSFIISFLTMYIFTILLGTLAVSIADPAGIITNFTAVLSCISNVGPGLDKVGPTCTFSFYSNFSKFILSFIMIAGRLELSTLFIIFTPYYWKPGRV
ncbi:MAG: TrkH family potassium uptake protein [Mogibacterium sp.]|nr:TrkH family potassium uptake protein [Mogibacterium sp.]